MGLNDGGVLAFGRLTGGNGSSSGTQTFPRSLPGTGTSPITHVATWSHRDNSNNATDAGALAIGADGTVRRWHTDSPNGSLNATTVAGNLTGVIEIYPTDRGYYIHTTSGVSWVPTRGNNPSVSNLSGLQSGDSILQLSTWGDGFSRPSSAGAWALTTDGRVYESNAGGNFQQVNGLPGDLIADPIRRIGAHAQYRFVLTESGNLYRQYGNGSWVHEASNVQGLGSWGRTMSSDSHYAGVTAINSAGDVVVYLWHNNSLSGTAYTQTAFGDYPVVQVYAEDGIYSALNSNGEFFSWTGNPDNPNYSNPQEVEGYTFTDAQIWGWHDGSQNYVGGGFASPATGCNWGVNA